MWVMTSAEALGYFQSSLRDEVLQILMELGVSSGTGETRPKKKSIRHGGVTDSGERPSPRSLTGSFGEHPILKLRQEAHVYWKQTRRSSAKLRRSWMFRLTLDKTPSLPRPRDMPLLRSLARGSAYFNNHGAPNGAFGLVKSAARVLKDRCKAKPGAAKSETSEVLRVRET